MSDIAAYRTLAAAPVMGAATGFRMGLAWLQVWTSHSPDLVKLGTEILDPAEDPDRAARAYGREFMDCYKESVQASLNEIKGGIRDVEAHLNTERLTGVDDPVDLRRLDQARSGRWGCFRPGHGESPKR